MPNQIGDFFDVYPRSEALDGIAKHIHNTWEPRMRDQLKTIMDSEAEGLKPLVAEAMELYFKGPLSSGRRVSVDPRPQAPRGAKPSFATVVATLADQVVPTTDEHLLRLECPSRGARHEATDPTRSDGIAC
jgi:formate dehydrogenase subunit delta